jgi:hypothetical protein
MTMADTRYKPPTKVTVIDIPYTTLVNQADPDFQRAKHRELEYPAVGGGRSLYGDPTRRGAYAPADSEN